ncbi:hypothetical protein GS429_14250 [Natronorubrum sp. JWXQ-INN-674]|uniref:Uncharacterized protein n=1 Tax=Natronorubrum halalkaliphilum TaxID=2691917 RepID=A0A6B0VQ44_9EURY|nr:hypothetical protein [Natronorubrum halalkaliphilum]MXV63207.1 hypothetical protein [Natronorubrum halalkaliphilum]
MSRLTRLTELRRALPLAAAALFLLALTMPVWRITLTAPQYMEPLTVKLYAYPRLEGDITEIQALNSYVGFYYPDPVYVDPNYDVHENAVAVPEWVLGPVAFVALAASSVAVALLPSGKRLKRGLAGLFGGTLFVFVTMGALIQYRLHQTGHSLDPAAPLSGVDGFTPPLAGSYEVANISGTAWFGPGGYLLVAAVGLLFVAFRFRGSEETLGDVPELARDRRERANARLRRWRGGEASGTTDQPDSDPVRSTADGDRP